MNRSSLSSSRFLPKEERPTKLSNGVSKKSSSHRKPTRKSDPRIMADIQDFPVKTEPTPTTHTLKPSYHFGHILNLLEQLRNVPEFSEDIRQLPIGAFGLTYCHSARASLPAILMVVGSTGKVIEIPLVEPISISPIEEESNDTSRGIGLHKSQKGPNQISGVRTANSILAECHLIVAEKLMQTDSSTEYLGKRKSLYHTYEPKRREWQSVESYLLAKSQEIGLLPPTPVANPVSLSPTPPRVRNPAREPVLPPIKQEPSERDVQKSRTRRSSRLADPDYVPKCKIEPKADNLTSKQIVDVPGPECRSKHKEVSSVDVETLLQDFRGSSSRETRSKTKANSSTADEDDIDTQAVLRTANDAGRKRSSTSDPSGENQDLPARLDQKPVHASKYSKNTEDSVPEWEPLGLPNDGSSAVLEKLSFHNPSPDETSVILPTAESCKGTKTIEPNEKEMVADRLPQVATDSKLHAQLQAELLESFCKDFDSVVRTCLRTKAADECTPQKLLELKTKQKQAREKMDALEREDDELEEMQTQHPLDLRSQTALTELGNRAEWLWNKYISKRIVFHSCCCTFSSRYQAMKTGHTESQSMSLLKSQYGVKDAETLRDFLLEAIRALPVNNRCLPSYNGDHRHTIYTQTKEEQDQNTKKMLVRGWSKKDLLKLFLKRTSSAKLLLEMVENQTFSSKKEAYDFGVSMGPGQKNSQVAAEVQPMPLPDGPLTQTQLEPLKICHPFNPDSEAGMAELHKRAEWIFKYAEILKEDDDQHIVYHSCCVSFFASNTSKKSRHTSSYHFEELQKAGLNTPAELAKYLEKSIRSLQPCNRYLPTFNGHHRRLKSQTYTQRSGEFWDKHTLRPLKKWQKDLPTKLEQLTVLGAVLLGMRIHQSLRSLGFKHPS